MVMKFSPGLGDRVSRNFAYSISEGKKAAEACSDGITTWAESFVEQFMHIVFHLQGTAKIGVFWKQCWN